MAALRSRLTDAAYALGWSVVRGMPETAAYATFDRLADGVWRRRGRGARQLETNLARVVGPEVGPDELRDLTRQAMRSYFRYWVEAFRLPALGRAGVLRHADAECWHRVRDAVAQRGAVAALPHMGNWDMAGAWAAFHQMPVTTVAERLEPESLFDRFVAYRASIGIEVCAAGDDGLIDVLEKRARAHRLVALVADRDLGANGVDVPFFGATARMPAGPAIVALRAGVPLFPISLWYDGIARMRVHDPIPVPEEGSERARAEAMTVAVAARFERAIAEHPRDWHMLQRLWLEDQTRAGVSG